MQRAVVNIKGEFDSGSGVVVAPETVVTCYHAVSTHVNHGDNLFVEYTTASGGTEKLKATVIRCDGDQDTCLLHVTGLPIDPVPLADAIPDIGAPVTAVGYAKGAQHVRTGVMEYIHRIGNEPPILLTTAKTEPGFSGGGLFNAQFQIIGIPAINTGNGCISLPAIKAILGRTDNEKKPLTIPPRTEIGWYHYSRPHYDPPPQSERLNLWVLKNPDSYLAHINRGSILHDVPSVRRACEIHLCYEALVHLVLVLLDQNYQDSRAQETAVCEALSIGWDLFEQNLQNQAHASALLLKALIIAAPHQHEEDIIKLYDYYRSGDCTETNSYSLACFVAILLKLGKEDEATALLNQAWEMQDFFQNSLLEPIKDIRDKGSISRPIAASFCAKFLLTKHPPLEAFQKFLYLYPQGSPPVVDCVEFIKATRVPVELDSRIKQDIFGIYKTVMSYVNTEVDQYPSVTETGHVRGGAAVERSRMKALVDHAVRIAFGEVEPDAPVDYEWSRRVLSKLPSNRGR